MKSAKRDIKGGAGTAPSGSFPARAALPVLNGVAARTRGAASAAGTQMGCCVRPAMRDARCVRALVRALVRS